MQLKALIILCLLSVIIYFVLDYKEEGTSVFLVLSSLFFLLALVYFGLYIILLTYGI